MTLKELTKINIGMKIYENFVLKITNKTFHTPKTETLKMFCLLKEKEENELLLRELLKELLTNFDEEEIVCKDGKLFYKLENLEEIK